MDQNVHKFSLGTWKPSKASTHIIKVYQDFMHYEGISAGLQRDLAPEEKVRKIIHMNKDMIVKYILSEVGHPNKNPAEAFGVKPLKTDMEAIMIRQNI